MENILKICLMINVTAEKPFSLLHRTVRRSPKVLKEGGAIKYFADSKKFKKQYKNFQKQLQKLGL